MKTTERMISVGELTPCPWNPRGEITPESVADLTASIKARGLLQNIGVWKRPDADGYYVIFGNRRFVACVNAMMPKIRCRVFECSDVEAHEITRIENEARLGVSPIEDAKLIGKMLDLGYSGKEIAAHFGVSEAQITRRRKLLDLSPAWASRALEVDIPTDMLERVAAYSRDIQDKVLSKARNWQLREGWEGCAHYFRDITANLDDCPFVRNREDLAARCRACQKRTGVMPDLFDGVPEGGMGSCLDPKCFKYMRSAYRQQIIDDNVPGSVSETVVVHSKYELRYGEPKVKKLDDKNTAAYVYVDEDKAKAIVRFGPSKAEQKKKEEAKRAAQKREEEKRDALDKLTTSARQKIKKYWNGADLKKLTLAAVSGKNGVVNAWQVLELMFRLNLSTYMEPLLRKHLKGLSGDKPFDSWWNMVGKQIKNELGGYVGARIAFNAELFYPALMQDLTPEEREALAADANRWS